MPRPAISLDERQRMSPPARLTLVEAEAADHEQDCTNRWNLLIRIMMWGGGGVAATLATIIIAAVGWMFNQLHQDQEREYEMLRQAVRPPIAASAAFVTPTKPT